MESKNSIDGSMSQLASENSEQGGGAGGSVPQLAPSSSSAGSTAPSNLPVESLRSSVHEGMSGGPKGGNLFFQFGGQDDEMEQLIELQRGKEYEATYVVSESTGKFREIIMNISLTGIKVYEPKNKKRKREFDIEAILQYSYNRANQKFTFAYLEADGVLTNYRFISKDFFEIHQTLGNAIAMLVKVKNNEIQLPEIKEPDEKSASNEHLASEDQPQAKKELSGELLTATKSAMELERSKSDAGKSMKEMDIRDDKPAPQPNESSKEESTPVSPASKDDTVSVKDESFEANSRPVSQAFPDSPTTSGVVVHVGGDDDAVSIMTNDDRISVISPDDDHDPSTEGLYESQEKDAPSPTKGAPAGAKLTKKDKASFTKTLRSGWSLFNAPRGATLKGSKKPTQSTQELSSIQESGANSTFLGSHDTLSIPKGGGLRTGGIQIDRRKSVQELFNGNNSGPTSPKSPLRDDSDSTSDKKSTLSAHGSTMAQAEISASSVDSASMRENRELPPVDVKYDAYGREVLIKNLKNGKYDITAGTVDLLVESLAEEAPPDTIYIEVFLLTFRHFMTPVALIKLLQKRFNFVNEDGKPNSIIRVRVVSVLKKWAERHYYDFRFPEMQEAFNAFLDELNKTECAKYGAQIKTILDAEMERSKTFTEVKKPVTPPEVLKLFNGIDFVTTWNPKKVAQELTLQDLKLFRTIKPDEFCLFLWGEKNDPRIANFNSYIERFNKIGFWVSTVIVSQKDIKRRVEAVEKFIQVLKYCQRYQNYSSTMAVLSGLNTTAVSRLKKTWEIVTKGRQYSTYKDIEAKMSYRGNFKSYRDIESQAKQPFIPFFGLYVKDLTFMNDGNQKHLVLQTTKDSSSNPLVAAKAAQQPQAGQTGSSNGSEEEKKDIPPPAQLINFEKCRGITDKIHAIRVFQQSTYKFEEEKEDNKEGFFSQFSNQFNNGTDADLAVYLGHPYGPPYVDDEKKLLDMSRECEPSERTGGNTTSGGNYVATSGNPASSTAQTAANKPQQQPSQTPSATAAVSSTASR